MEFILEIIVIIFLITVAVATWALLIGAICKGIKDAKNQKKETKTIVLNIVLTDKDSKS